MMIRLSSVWCLFSILPLLASGCCCMQGVPSCGSCGISSCGTTSCPTGTCGLGAIAGLASCRGACGDVYVDEWISEPPTIDNCGYPCGGCGQCRYCTPVRSLLRLLWGRPYIASCSTCLGGPTCGCDDCASGGSYVDGGEFHGADCNCGVTHAPEIQAVPETVAPTPEYVPTPVPELESTSARRLNPAAQRRAISQVSARR